MPLASEYNEMIKSKVSKQYAYSLLSPGVSVSNEVVHNQLVCALYETSLGVLLVLWAMLTKLLAHHRCAELCYGPDG
jgi:hypothetical protein